MAIPTIESLTPLLDEKTVGIAGDSLVYDGDAMRGFVDYGEQARLGIGAIEQDMVCQIRRVDVPTRPGSINRITLPAIAGKTFRPSSVQLDDGGTYWVFTLKEVKA